MNETERQLIDLLLDGELPEAESVNLLARLEDDPVAIVYFAERTRLHSDLRHSLKRRKLQQWATAAAPSLGQPAVNLSRRRFACHPLAAAALGLAVGLFSATVVFGYFMPRIGKAITLLHESFESDALPHVAGVPTTTGVWGGDAAGIIDSDSTVEAKDGGRLLRLEPATMDLWNRQFFMIDLTKLPDVQEGRSRVVRVVASFHSSASDVRDRYLARAAAFAEWPESIRPEWMTTLWGSEENLALAMAAKAQTFMPGTPGWQTMQLTLDIPRGSRVLVLSFWAATMNAKAELRAAHFLDDVRVILETLPSKP